MKMLVLIVMVLFFAVLIAIAQPTAPPKVERGGPVTFLRVKS